MKKFCNKMSESFAGGKEHDEPTRVRLTPKSMRVVEKCTVGRK